MEKLKRWVPSFLQIKAVSLALLVIALPHMPLRAMEVEATSSPDGYLQISGSQLLSDACLSLGELTPGAPERSVEISNAQPFILTINHNGNEVCAQMIAESPFSIRVRDDRTRPFVIIYRFYQGFPGHLEDVTDRVLGEVLMKGFLE